VILFSRDAKKGVPPLRDGENPMPEKRNPSLVTQIALLLAASVVCALASQWLMPKRIAWVGSWANYVESKAREEGVPLVDLARAREIATTQSHIVFDARTIVDYEKGRLPGAFALPYAEADQYFGALIPLPVADQPVMTYCSGKDCDDALELARFLHRNGFTNVVIFLGGWEEWNAAGLPVEGRAP
jgi:rhodanese-related sulfurtransferase